MPTPPSRSPWSDLDRPPLSVARLRHALVDAGTWRAVDVVDVTGSTNADLVARARTGEPAGAVLIAEEQRAGRGRLDRTWEAPPRAAVLMSVLLRPQPPAATWPLLPLVTGVSVVEAVRAVTGMPATLKWPNDVMAGDRKLGGVLAQTVEDAVVVGIGLNVSTRRAELPVPVATSITEVGGPADREPLVKEMLRALRRRYDEWSAAGGAAASVVPAYRDVCDTIGREVRVTLPGGESIAGVVSGVDDDGQLVVGRGADRRRFSVGDVVHVRPAS